MSFVISSRKSANTVRPKIAKLGIADRASERVAFQAATFTRQCTTARSPGGSGEEERQSSRIVRERASEQLPLERGREISTTDARERPVSSPNSPGARSSRRFARPSFFPFSFCADLGTIFIRNGTCFFSPCVFTAFLPLPPPSFPSTSSAPKTPGGGSASIEAAASGRNPWRKHSAPV